MAKLPAHYKLKKDHPTTYEILDARDNKTFHVAKKGLDDAAHKSIGKIEKFAEGGVAGDGGDAETPSIPAALDPNGPAMPDWGMKSYATPDGNPPQMAPTADAAAPVAAAPKPDLALPPTAQAPSQVADADSPASLLAKYKQYSDQGVQGVQALGEAKAQESQGEADVLKNRQPVLEKVVQDAKIKHDALDAENKALTQGVLNTKINPQNYVQSMTSGNRISSAIAIGIGALGAGLSGQPNVALGMINKAIEDDIQAQKENLGTKKTLLSVNLQKYGDLDRATQATMMQMNAITQGQIALNAAKYGPKINQANTQMLLGNMQRDNLINQQSLATNLATQQVAKQATSGEGIPAQALGLLPEKMQPNMVRLPNNMYANAGSPENAKAVNEAAAPYKPLMDDLNELKSLNTITTPFSKAQRDRASALQSHIVTELNDMAKAHRISEADIGFQEGQLSRPASIFNKLSTDWNASTDTLMKSLSNKMDNVYRTYVPAYKGQSNINFKPKAK